MSQSHFLYRQWLIELKMCLYQTIKEILLHLL